MNAPQQPAPQKQSAATAWTLLLTAAAIEVVFALSSGANGGFTKLVPSIITVVAGGGGVYILSLALKSIDVGIGYTVWTGIGAVGSVLLAAVLYGEEITLGKVFCFLAIIGGVIGLHLTSEAPEDEPVVDGSSEPEVEPISHPSAQAAGPPPLSGAGPTTSDGRGPAGRPGERSGQSGAAPRTHEHEQMPSAWESGESWQLVGGRPTCFRPSRGRSVATTWRSRLVPLRGPESVRTRNIP